MRYSDEELLKLVGEERKRSIGFGEAESGELIEARERALRFYRGDVSKDIPVMANRSAAVSTDVAEAIETALPDLVEIFIGGDDVATFQARSAQDEPQAQVESDYVKHVIFAENDGFTTFNTAFKDALLVKTGLFHWWWEEEEDEETSPPTPAEAAPCCSRKPRPKSRPAWRCPSPTSRAR
jgi:ABC-type sugar transport system substrate-binding protein